MALLLFYIRGLFKLLLPHLVVRVVVIVVDYGNVAVVEHHLVVLPGNRQIRGLLHNLCLLSSVIVCRRVDYIKFQKLALFFFRVLWQKAALGILLAKCRCNRNLWGHFII